MRVFADKLYSLEALPKGLAVQLSLRLGLANHLLALFTPSATLSSNLPFLLSSAIPVSERFRADKVSKRTWREFVAEVQAGKRFRYIDLSVGYSNLGRAQRRGHP